MKRGRWGTDKEGDNFESGDLVLSVSEKLPNTSRSDAHVHTHTSLDLYRLTAFSNSYDVQCFS